MHIQDEQTVTAVIGITKRVNITITIEERQRRARRRQKKYYQTKEIKLKAILIGLYNEYL